MENGYETFNKMAAVPPSPEGLVWDKGRITDNVALFLVH